MKTMLFNPYTGTPRHPSDIASDPEGILLLDPDEPVRAAPTAVEPDERAMANELIKVAAWLLSPEPRRKLAELEDATHIGHRQFHRAYEGTFETLRLKAIEIRNFVDAARASKGTK